MEMNYDENTLHQLEQELQVEILPGTEVMTDVGSHHFVKSSHGSNRVLVPQPSDDPNDPLNWSAWWKFSAMACATAVSFSQGFGPLALAPMFPYLMADFDSSLTDVIQFVGVCILVLGFSNFIWVPISTAFGRRPVLILSTIVCLASNIWRAKAQTYNSFMGACVLNGIGAGPAETLQPAITADVMFLHDRGTYNTLYFVTYFGSLMVGPIISGPMSQYSNQRNFWWLNVAMLGATTIAVVFLFPETKWHRVHPDEITGKIAPSPPASKERVAVEDKEIADPEKNVTGTNELTQTATEARDPYLGRGYPNRAQFGFYSPNPTPLKSLLLDFWIPWKLFSFPIVEFASFVVSWSASSFLTVNLTQSQAFSVAPYTFSAETIGFFNFALLIGSFIGLATAGPLSDYISMRATLRNKGIREPEMRLPTMIPYVFIMMLGNFVVAYGYQNGWDWRAIVIIGFTCAGIQVAALPPITSTYAIDSYKPVAGSIFVSITVNKNLWGYGFSKFITPWIISNGYVPPIMLNMGLITLWSLFGILFYFKGKSFRRWTRNSSVHRM